MTNSLTNDIVVGGRPKRRRVTFNPAIDWQKEEEKADRRHQRRLKRKRRRRKKERMSSTFTQEAKDDACAALIKLIDKREDILRMCKKDKNLCKLVRKCAKAIGYSFSSKDYDKIQNLRTALDEMANCATKGAIQFHQDDDRLVSMLLQISVKYHARHLATYDATSKDSVKAVSKADNDESNSDDKSSHSDGENDPHSHSGSEGSSGSESEYSSMGCPDNVIVEIRMPLCEVSANTTRRSDSTLSSMGSETSSESSEGESSSLDHDSCSESSESSNLPAKKKPRIY